MALAAGLIGSLLPKLHDLSKDKHIVPTGVQWEIKSLIAKLESTQSTPSGVLEDDQLDKQVNLWATDATKLSDHIEDLISKFISSSPESGAPGDFIAMIKLMHTTGKDRRKFARDIRNANGQVKEIVDRHERYRIDYGFPDPGLNELPKDMATVAELEALLADAYKLPRRVKEDLEFLKAELRIMVVVFQKIAKVPAGELDEVTEGWADGMRFVSRNIKRAVEDFKGVPRLGGNGAKSTVSSMKAQRQFASKIRNLKDCLLAVADRRQRCDLPKLRVPKLNSAKEVDSVGSRIRHPDHLQDGESLFAISGHRKALVELLTDEGTTSKQQVKMASIVGIAGVGKTTLAKAVYSSLAESFDCKAWVSLPTLPGMMGVLFDLLQQIVGRSQPAAPEKLGAALEAMDGACVVFQEDNGHRVVLDEQGLIDKICEKLQNKRYFIVIDDLWDLTSWNTLKKALIGENNASAVLTTSRRVDIGEHVGGVYRLGPLSKTDSRRLFYNTEDKFPTSLSEKLEVFIEKCGGIPATIISTAVSLASNPWTVHDSVYYKGEQGPDDTTRIFDKSYSELPFHLKRCLLYLSLFRKGYVIRAEQLVWQWIAEGFILEIKGENLQEVGESYLKELIKRQFLKSVEVDAEGRALYCSVYDLVHDLMISKSRAQMFVEVLDGTKGRPLTNEVHRLSIQGNSSDQHALEWSSLSNLKTLLVHSDANLMQALSAFRQLRVLDLGGCDSLKNDDLKGIDNSFLLKYLAIGGNCITGLPKEIGRLNFLQTLDLRLSGLKELPEGIVQLRHLERLCVNSHMKIPASIVKMKGLKELGDIYISKPELLKELFKLTKLKILRIAIWTCDDSYNVALLEYLHSLVPDRHQNIQSLSVFTCCPLDFMNKLNEKWNPPGLQKLEIRESSFLTLPAWIGSLHNLFSLTIEVHKLSQQMVDILGKLQNLCTLSLTSKRVLEGNFGIVPDGFKNLSSFKFVSSAMGQLFASEPKGMQKLKRLQLSFKALQTKDINQLFSFGMEDLCSLEHVRVEIICFNASRQVVENAEAAIRDAISRSRSRCPNLEIQRVWEKDMIESEEKDSENKFVVSSVKEEQQKETKNQKSSSWKIRVISKKFWQKKRRVTRKYRILSLDMKSRIFTVQAL